MRNVMEGESTSGRNIERHYVSGKERIYWGTGRKAGVNKAVGNVTESHGKLRSAKEKRVESQVKIFAFCMAGRSRRYRTIAY